MSGSWTGSMVLVSIVGQISSVEVSGWGGGISFIEPSFSAEAILIRLVEDSMLLMSI